MKRKNKESDWKGGLGLEHGGPGECQMKYELFPEGNRESLRDVGQRNKAGQLSQSLQNLAMHQNDHDGLLKIPGSGTLLPHLLNPNFQGCSPETIFLNNLSR